MAAPVSFIRWFGLENLRCPLFPDRPALNKAHPAEDKPHLPAYLPVAASQSLTVLSPLAEAKVLPFGLNATE